MMMKKKNIQSLILLTTPSLLFYSLLLVARAQQHQQPLVITSTDETGDILLRPYATVATVENTVDGDNNDHQEQQQQQWIMYDFKPAFPPYDKHKMEELLLMPTTTHRTASSGDGTHQLQEEVDNSKSSNDNNTDNNSVGTTATDKVEEEAVVHQTLWEEGDLLINVDADDKNNDELQRELIEDDDIGQGEKMNDNNNDGGGGGSTIDADNAHIQTSVSDSAELNNDDSENNNNDKERPQQRHRDVNAKLDDGNIAIPATRPQDSEADAATAPPVGPLPDPIDDMLNLDDSSEKEGLNTVVKEGGGEGEEEGEDDDNESLQEQHAEDKMIEESADGDAGIVTDSVNESSESNSHYNEGASPTLVEEEEKEEDEGINGDNGSMEQSSENDAVEDVAAAETIDNDDVNELLEGISYDKEGGDTNLLVEEDINNDDRRMDEDTKQDLEIEIDATDATMSTEDRSTMEPSLEETKTTEEGEEQKINIQYDDPLPPTSSPSSSSSPSSNNKDANREFVTGLDDVDKLFESVEVPDELDVGADGSSMQDVLVGQALKIITKKVKSLGGAIKVKFDKVAEPVKKALPQLGLFGDDEDDDESDVNALFESIVNGNGNVVDPMDVSDEEDGGELSIKLKEKLKVLSEKMKLQQLREKVKSVKELQLFKSEEAQKVFGFTKRKWSQGKHLVNDLLSIFDSDDEDEDDFDLNDIQSLIR